MAVIRVSIKDKNTLELQEDARKGDVIDLGSLGTADIGAVSDALKAYAKKEAEKEFEVMRSKALEAELLKQEKTLVEKYNGERLRLEIELQKYKTIEQQNDEKIERLKKEHEQFLKAAAAASELKEQKDKEHYDRLLKDKQQEIDYYKEMKSKLSTKLVGESLEEHCEIEFEQRIRPFVSSNVSFGKDNDAVEGTKGDYIYCEKEENGVEVISIMFEMKNEEQGGISSKKKNDDFLKKLDNDRIKKNCEYAVLVSMLESDSELYNRGIVDVSHKYPKMYVIRPQFFVPLITLLRNAAMKAVSLKSELALIREQNTDITTFEDRLNDFKSAFGRNAGLFRNKISDAIERLEKQKKQIQDIIDLFRGGQQQLDWAGDKLDDLSVKKLTKGNPTMAAKFEEIRIRKKEDGQGA